MDRIKKHHKMIMGYSDSTTFLSYLNQHRMVTSYGPSVMGGFARLKNLPKVFKIGLKALLLLDQRIIVKLRKKSLLVLLWIY